MQPEVNREGMGGTLHCLKTEPGIRIQELIRSGQCRSSGRQAGKSQGDGYLGGKLATTGLV
jgi:hypothetical protein